MSWRAAEVGDDATIVGLCEALHAEDPDQDPFSAEQATRTLAALRAEPWRGRAAVLDLGGDLCGYALLISFWSNELGGELCVVDEIYVAPRARGSGHGSQLFAALTDGGGLWPGRPAALMLEVTPRNQRAVALYERLGFTGHNRSMRKRLPMR